MGTSWTKFDALVFSNFLRYRPKILKRKYGIHEGFNLWRFDGRIIVGGRPYDKLWEKYKKPYLRFQILRYKNPLKIWFFSQIHIAQIKLHIIVWFSYIFMILNWNQRKQILNFFSVFNGFHSQIYEILDTGCLNFLHITLGRVKNFSTGSDVKKWKKIDGFPWCGYIQNCSV